MKFLSLLLLLSASAFAASGSGNVSNVVGYGGGTIAVSPSINSTTESNLIIPMGDVGTYKTLTSYTGQGGTNWVYLHLIDTSSGSNAQYQVPNGKSFHIMKICAQNNAPATQLSFSIGTSTATFTDSSATVPTSPVYFSQAAQQSLFSLPATGGAAAPGFSIITQSCWNFPMKFNQNLYPFIHSYVGSGSFYLIGVEK